MSEVFAFLKHYYGFSDMELNYMSPYRMHKYMENIMAILGKKKQEPDERDKQFMDKYKVKTRIEDNNELIDQAKKLGLKVPRNY